MDELQRSLLGFLQIIGIFQGCYRDSRDNFRDAGGIIGIF